MNPSEPKTESKEKNIEVIFKMKFIKENGELLFSRPDGCSDVEV